MALWSWDIQVDNCAICRNHIMDLCIECQANPNSTVTGQDECSVAWGACNVRGKMTPTCDSNIGVARFSPALYFPLAQDEEGVSTR